ncbi:hypothetical protein ACGFX8_36920 [Streptomyces sp. NPDC048362]|uniref:hypothetical protein n=1 Tax=Streptomyces sp. NPDC048362 TaxID=3365539 RepID=UPI0037230778
MLIDYANFTDAASGIRGQLGVREGTSAMSLLKRLCFLAEQDAQNVSTNQIVAVYDFSLSKIKDNAARQEEAARRCEDILRSRENAEKVRRIRTSSENPNGHIIITRGTTPLQALNILTNCTFGGSALNSDHMSGAPSEKAADDQTGFGSKGTGASRIEEWSLGELRGFATDGFLLIARASETLVTLPKTEFSKAAGERGVCGFADAPLVEVAILERGAKPVEVSGADKGIDGYLKNLGATEATFSQLLHLMDQSGQNY